LLGLVLTCRICGGLAARMKLNADVSVGPSEHDAALLKLCGEICLDKVRTIQEWNRLDCDQCGDKGKFDDPKIQEEEIGATMDALEDYKKNYLADTDKQTDLVKEWRLSSSTSTVQGFGGQQAQVRLNSEQDVSALERDHKTVEAMCRGRLVIADIERIFNLESFKNNYMSKDGKVANMLVAKDENGRNTGFTLFWVTPSSDSTLDVYIDWICSAAKVPISGRRLFNELKRTLRTGYPQFSTFCVDLMTLGGADELAETYEGWGFQRSENYEEDWHMKNCFSATD